MSINTNNNLILCSFPQLLRNEKTLTEEELLIQLSIEARARAVAQTILDDHEVYFPNNYMENQIPYTPELMNKVIEILNLKGYQVQQVSSNSHGTWLRVSGSMSI